MNQMRVEAVRGNDMVAAKIGTSFIDTLAFAELWRKVMELALRIKRGFQKSKRLHKFFVVGRTSCHGASFLE